MKDCSTKTFRALMWAQALDALNVNLFKLLVIFFLVEGVASTDRSVYVGAVQLTFVAPYLLFSLYAGYVADRFSKTSVIRWAKGFELFVVTIGALCIAYGLTWALLPVFFFMALHSAVLSPAKYGIMPEILDEKQLSKGNGYLEFWTMVSIIGGTALSGALKDVFSGHPWVIGTVLIGVAAVGLSASFSIEKTPTPAVPPPLEQNPFSGVFRHVGEIKEDQSLFLTFLGISYFWAIGSVVQSNVLLYAENLLGLDHFGQGVLAAVIGVGIGAGSIFAGRVSEGKVEIGLIPIGAAGMGIFALLLSITHNSYVFTYLSLVGLGASAGLFVVPLSAYFQHAAPIEKRGRYLAANNFVTYAAMFASQGMFVALTSAGVSSATIFAIIGLMSLGVSVFALMRLPGACIRAVNWLLSHTVYNLRTFGTSNVPRSGGALLVCNHVSFADPSLLLAAIDRPIRFIMYRPIYEARLIKPIAKAMGAIPIDPVGGPKALVAALNEAREAIQNGELVCIFAEGALTRIGHLLPFSKGLERIMKGVDAPIIPVHLDELWGSIFSYREGKFFFKMPKEIPYPVTATFGTPLPGSSPTHVVRQAVQELAAESFTHRRRQHQLLHVGFLAQMRRSPFRVCLADSNGKELRSFQVAVASLALRGYFKRTLDEEKMVGVMLPPSVEGVLVNLALLMLGRVPVNLNFTASKDSVRSAIQQCQISTVVTSEKFIEKIDFPELPQMMYLEDLRLEISWKSKIGYFLAVLLLPESVFELLFLDRSIHREDLATVIFSSGSTGEPKGVMLSHGNICANLESMYDIFDLKKDDVFLGVLPFFHSFGFTGTIWLPLLGGNKVVFHPNPMDAETIGKLAAQHRVTVLLSTPTFLLGYIRRCEPEQFKFLRHVVVGAEKLKERVASAFKERFGIVPLEGYGATELSPVAMMNIPDFEGTVSGGAPVKQVGAKLGTVGHPLPGVAVRVVDPDTRALLAPGEEGLLLVKGPNVMLGYLRNPEKTAEVLQDGWYVTGDIAKIDEDGFVTITDRLSRFSKIGGEMIPHGKLEEELHQVLGATEQLCVVTALPDDKKGEKLIVLYRGEINPADLVSKLSKRGLPNLWIPKKENFCQVDAFPLLGSGKLDLKAIKEMAKERCAH